jgi:hypothetical protein
MAKKEHIFLWQSQELKFLLLKAKILKFQFTQHINQPPSNMHILFEGGESAHVFVDMIYIDEREEIGQIQIEMDAQSSLSLMPVNIKPGCKFFEFEPPLEIQTNRNFEILRYQDDKILVDVGIRILKSETYLNISASSFPRKLEILSSDRGIADLVSGISRYQPEVPLADLTSIPISN